MPLLGGLLSALFVGIAEFFAKWLTRKIAAAAAAIAIMATITATLYLFLGGLVTSIAYALPSNSGFLTGVWLACPDNGPAVVGACLATDAAVAVYRLNVANVQLTTYAP